jgi:hypothetical protein
MSIKQRWFAATLVSISLLTTAHAQTNTFDVSGELSIGGNQVCVGGYTCIETILYSFTMEFVLNPNAEDEYEEYVDPTSISVTSFGALGSSFTTGGGLLLTPATGCDGDTNYLEFLDSAGDEIDLHECGNLLSTPVPPTLSWVDLYGCATTTCLTDFAPPPYTTFSPPLDGLFVTGSGYQTVTAVPEPGTLTLIAVDLVGFASLAWWLGFYRRWKTSKL